MTGETKCFQHRVHTTCTLRMYIHPYNALPLSGNELKFPSRPHAHISVRTFSQREPKQAKVQIANKFFFYLFLLTKNLRNKTIEFFRKRFIIFIILTLFCNFMFLIFNIFLLSFHLIEISYCLIFYIRCFRDLLLLFF